MTTGRLPFSFGVFRALWIATVISNIGTWMHDVGAGWLMTSMSSSPFYVALVQAAATLPMFVLALPAGAIADIVDRRTMLIASQCLGLLAAAGLAALTVLGWVTPDLLLAVTVLLGVSTALSAPIFQAIVPELVDKSTLPDAVALNSLGINIARAIGPAIGGIIVAAAGPPAVFALNSATVIAVLIVLARWRREVPANKLPPEHFWGAIKAGYRYARHSRPLQIVLLRTAAFFIFSSALWAMLPIVARRELGLTATGYGILLGCMGAGAILGAIALKHLRRITSDNTISIGATVLYAGAMCGLALSGTGYAAGIAMFAAGTAWIAMLTALNVAAQTVSPGWVKARSLAVYLLVFQGAMTGGSVLWGMLAAQAGVTTAFLIAAMGQLAALVVAFTLHLPGRDAADLSPSDHWAEPVTATRPVDDHGPVLVQIEYRASPDRLADLVAALHRFKHARLRDGAIRWDIWQDAARPDVIVEAFVVESWLEHQRQHTRTTNADHIDQALLNRLHSGDTPPVVRHMLHARP